jgi:hypothetical protein
MFRSSTSLSALAGLATSLAVSSSTPAQTPVSRIVPSVPSPILGLPPGPPVGDWQPRGRAIIGGTIVITGQNFRPADFEAAIGPAKVKLPVRLASSTSTRIELSVPDGALGVRGTLAVGYPGTQGTVLETDYRIDPLTPSVIDASAGTSVTPFLERPLVVRIREFTGARANADNITFTGCGFHKHAGVSYGTIERAADLSLRIAIAGWFDRSGSCQLGVNVPALSATGASLGTVQVTTPFSVDAPQQYVIDNTQQLAPKLHATLVHFGVGNICESPTNGVTSSGSDFAVISRGGPFDVECVFRTDPWLLPPGVRLAAIEWSSARTGNRCGLDGEFSHTLPGASSFSFTRGTIVVRPDANQPVTDFFLFGDNSIVDDGVTFASGLNGPRTLIKPLTIGIQCVSSLTVLSTGSGTFPPTTEPQSYTFILRRIVLEGPPGKSISDLLK